MEQMHADRLMKLARFLWVLPAEKFDYRTIVKGKNVPRKELDCGSTACAIGWCPVLWPDLVEYYKPTINNYGGSDYYVVPLGYDTTNGMIGYQFSKVLFGLTDSETSGLFLPRRQHRIGMDNLPDTASPKDVAALIAAYVGQQCPTTNTTLA